MTKQMPEGKQFYAKAGLSKAIVVHVSPATHRKLTALAAKSERSLQITVRRILEEGIRLQK